MPPIRIPRWLPNLMEKWHISNSLWGRILTEIQRIPARNSDDSSEILRNGEPLPDWRQIFFYLTEDIFIHSFRCIYTIGDVWVVQDLSHESSSMNDHSSISDCG
jgi:hypothetical protein